MSRRLIWCCSGSRSRSGNFKTEFLPLGDRRIVRVLRPRRPRRRFAVSDSFKSVIYVMWCDVIMWLCDYVIMSTITYSSIVNVDQGRKPDVM